MHRNKAIWGDDAEKFMPERWLLETNTKTDAPSPVQRGSRIEARLGVMKSSSKAEEYIPFLEGARTCPSQHMTLTQYAWILIRFAQRFETIDNRDPEFDFIEDIKFGKQSKNGMQVSFETVQHGDATKFL